MNLQNVESRTLICQSLCAHWNYLSFLERLHCSGWRSHRDGAVQVPAGLLQDHPWKTAAADWSLRQGPGDHPQTAVWQRRLWRHQHPEQTARQTRTGRKWNTCLILHNTLSGALGRMALLWPALITHGTGNEVNSDCYLTAGRHVVRCGHQQRGHCGQLCCLRLGAVHRSDQCSDGGVRGSLSHPVSRWDDQEPTQLNGWTSRRWQGQRPRETPRSLGGSKAKPYFILLIKCKCRQKTESSESVRSHLT